VEAAEAEAAAKAVRAVERQPRVVKPELSAAHLQQALKRRAAAEVAVNEELRIDPRGMRSP
jgi:hypothetical protein